MKRQSWVSNVKKMQQRLKIDIFIKLLKFYGIFLPLLKLLGYRITYYYTKKKVTTICEVPTVGDLLVDNGMAAVPQLRYTSRLTANWGGGDPGTSLAYSRVDPSSAYREGIIEGGRESPQRGGRSCKGYLHPSHGRTLLALATSGTASDGSLEGAGCGDRVCLNEGSFDASQASNRGKCTQWVSTLGELGQRGERNRPPERADDGSGDLQSVLHGLQEGDDLNVQGCLLIYCRGTEGYSWYC